MYTKLFYTLIICSLSILSFNELFSQKITYPATRKSNQIDDYHGEKVADPYRWLEDDNAEETKKWVEEQNKVTFGYLQSIPFRQKIAARLEKAWNFERYSVPFKKGDTYFYYHNNGLQNQAVLYSQKKLTDKGSVLIDPNQFEKNAGALANFDVSKDGKYAVYGISESGSDWKKFKIKNLVTGTDLNDELKWIKFSDASWYENGFFYSKFDEPSDGNELSAQNTFQKVYYHTLGKPQSDDVLIYEDKQNSKRYYDVSVTEDESIALLTISEGASGQNKLYFKFLNDKNMTGFKPVVDEFKNSYSVIDNIDKKLLVMTNRDAPRKKLVLIDPLNPSVEHWKTVIPESEENLVSVSMADGKLMVLTFKDVVSKLYIYSLDGKKMQEISLPGLGSVGGLSCKKDSKEVFYSFSSFIMPSTIYKYDIETNKSTIFREPKLTFNPAEYESKQVFYNSKDGTKIPLFLTYKKNLRLDGTSPTMLYAYGGFNISIQPSFSAGNIALLENGGIYAVANLRGGGEYGEKWHEAGMLEKKQNVFDDFIAAAEYLINQKYTNPKRLAIMGGSNGGLLVGAVMLQRPELFNVAFPRVGVLDMLRFHKFTVGWGWVSEYGSSDKADQFKFLKAYSPLHNIKSGAHYPATMIMTSDHDDRVVPAHSFKFAAELQDKYRGSEPMLIRIETSAGHGAGLPTKKAIESAADVWAFMFYKMGIQYK